MVRGQYIAILAGAWWYLVSISWYCLTHGGTGSVWGFYACVYIEKVEVWWGITDVLLTCSLTHRQQNIVLLSLFKV